MLPESISIKNTSFYNNTDNPPIMFYAILYAFKLNDKNLINQIRLVSIFNIKNKY